MIKASQLERMEQIAADTKKQFSYDKSNGTWSWFDKDEADNIDAWHTGFKSRFAALKDVVEPYL